MNQFQKEAFEIIEEYTSGKITYQEFKRIVMIMMLDRELKQDITCFYSYEKIKDINYIDGVYDPSSIFDTMYKLESIDMIMNIIKQITESKELPKIEHYINFFTFYLKLMEEYEEYDYCSKINKILKKLQFFYENSKHLAI